MPLGTRFYLRRNPGLGGGAAPLQLLTLPAFDGDTGRLDLGDWYNTRTSGRTVINEVGNVINLPDNTLAVQGARQPQNLMDASETIASWTGNGTTTIDDFQTFTIAATGYGNRASSPALVNSLATNNFVVRMKIKASQNCNVNVHTGWQEVTGLAVTTDFQDLSISFPTYSSIGNAQFLSIYLPTGQPISTTFTITEIQFENAVGSASPTIPSEYVSVGVGTGDELVTNGTFDTDSDWGKIASATISGGVANLFSGTDGIRQNEIITLDRSYVLTFDVTFGTATRVRVYLGGSGLLDIYATDGSGTKTVVATADGPNLIFYAIGGSLTLDNVSIKLATNGIGYYNKERDASVDVNGVLTEGTAGALLTNDIYLDHAPASTNLIPFSNDFSAWTPGNSPVITVNTNVSVFGDVTADTIADDSNTLAKYVRTDITNAANKQYTASIDVKKTIGAASFPMLSVYIYGATPVIQAQVILNTDTGVVTPRDTASGILGSGAVDAGEYWRLWVSTINTGTSWVGMFDFFPAVNTDAGAVFYPETTGSSVVCAANLIVGTVLLPRIPTSGSTASRLIDSIRHPVLGYFDGDEGSLYFKMTLPFDTDDFASITNFQGSFFDVNGSTWDGWVAYRNAGTGSTVLSYDGINAASLIFTNVPAGNTFAIRVAWSLSGNTRYIGVNNEFGASVDHVGFTETIIQFFRGMTGMSSRVIELEILDSYLTPAEHEARWP